MQIKDVKEIRTALEEHNKLLKKISEQLEIGQQHHQECCDKVVAALTKIAIAVDPTMGVTSIEADHESTPQ